MLVSSSGTALPSTCDALGDRGHRPFLRAAHRDVVVERDGLVDGLERVEPVRPHLADAEVDVDLRGRAHGHRQGIRQQGSAHFADPANSSAIRTNSEMLSDSPARQRIDTGRHQRGLGRLRRTGEVAQHAAQHLAAVGERGVDDREHLLAAHRGRRRLAPRPRDQPRVDVGSRPEDVAPDRPGASYVGVPGGLDRRDAVRLGAGRRRQPVGDLGLHHHQAVLQRGQQREQVQQHRHRDVVGQVGHQRGRRRAGEVGDLQRISEYDAHPVGLLRSELRDRARERRGEHGVDLDRGHRGAGLEQGQRERAEPGTDLDDDVRRQ